MAEEIKSALDVINAALAGDDVDEPTGLADEGVADEGDENLGDAVEEGDDSGAEGATGEVGKEGADADKSVVGASADVAAEAAALGVSTKRENGQFKSKEELAADVATAKAAATGGEAAAAKGSKPAGVEGKKGEVKKELDPVNDPIPKGLKAETETRIRTLIDRTKQAEEKVTVAETNFNTIVQGLQATGTTPEQYSEVLSFMQLFNSGDVRQQEQALGLLDDMADRLATMLGKDRTQTDPLKAHPDLQAAIQKGEVTRQIAQEVARNRNQQGFRTQLQSTANDRQKAEVDAQKETDDAKATLNRLEEGFRASDPLYERKKEQMLPLLQASFSQIRPSAWPAIFEKTYRAVKLGPAPVRRVVPPNQPMRAGKSPAAGGGKGGEMKTEPGSALDAVNAALSGMTK